MEYSPVIPIPPSICLASLAISAAISQPFLLAMLYLLRSCLAFIHQHTKPPVQQLCFGNFGDHFSKFFLLKLKSADRPVKLYSFFTITKCGIITIHRGTQCTPGDTDTWLWLNNPTALSVLLHLAKYFLSALLHCQKPVHLLPKHEDSIFHVL